MDKELIKALENNLKDLFDFNESLFDQGHTFWHCDGQDQEHNKPFYYYQINRTTHMSTCSTCYKLIENRKKIRSIQKKLGLDLLPLITNYKEETHVKRISVKNSSDFNPNYNYL